MWATFVIKQQKQVLCWIISLTRKHKRKRNTVRLPSGPAPDPELDLMRSPVTWFGTWSSPLYRHRHFFFVAMLRKQQLQFFFPHTLSLRQRRTRQPKAGQVALRSWCDSWHSGGAHPAVRSACLWSANDKQEDLLSGRLGRLVLTGRMCRYFGTRVQKLLESVKANSKQQFCCSLYTGRTSQLIYTWSCVYNVWHFFPTICNKIRYLCITVIT